MFIRKVDKNSGPHFRQKPRWVDNCNLYITVESTLLRGDYAELEYL
jgi:hypothetical protein